jgi:hypothetical protein
MKHELSHAAHFLQNGRANDIARQQIGRELHAAKPQPQKQGQRLHELGLPQPRQPLQQHVPPRQHANRNQLQQFPLPQNGRPQPVKQPADENLRLLDVLR